MRIHPGPLNNELLFLETQHRAYTIFHGQGDLDTVLDVRRGDGGLWRSLRNHDIPERVKIYIRRAGFQGVFDCGSKPLDHALITALVERWRPETNTFHLPIGEVSVTLQDVQLMWGLRIDGEVVTGCEKRWSVNEKRETCYRLLGILPEPGNFKYAQLKMTFLREVLDVPLPDNASNEECMQRARAYILLLLGGSIFPDTNDNAVHMNLLVLLEDFDRCSRLSWGSAALACLYRNLCRAATTEKVIAGPLMLLQVWAWSRIRATGPQYDGQNIGTPFGVRYVEQIASFQKCNDTLCIRFVWTPYDQYPHQLSTDWLCMTYIIYWEIVEEYLPNRVMRQFHLTQTIPTFPLSSPEENRSLHKLTRQGTNARNWSVDLAPQINHWMNRIDHYVQGDISILPTTVPTYMDWYRKRTVIHIIKSVPDDESSYRYQNVGGTFELAVEGLSQTREVLSQVDEENPAYQQLHALYETTGNYLHFTYGEKRPHGFYGTHVIPANNFALVMANPVERARVQRRTHDDHAGPSNRGERAPSHHDNEAGPSNWGERTPSHHCDEAGPSSMQYTPGIFNDGPPEPSGQYQYMTPPIPHLNPFGTSQESPDYGNLFANCYQPSLDSNFPVQRNNSVVRFDINIPWEENEIEMVVQEDELVQPVVQQDQHVQRRPTRNRRPPDCGTGGTRGHLH
ncbi:hypothetical protein OSB04_021582 [Centaurea solstitialis]|uniref:Aminotransferase-like plant mobile domain-containing protein n=1 Tax=Centaurea solstitialis TaxID=347529 RepID=A0AA38SW36_9ASTR|nr:hypothetical protein OSB04_021582 [Centaurea solstitialis]